MIKKREHVYSIDHYAYHSPLRGWNPRLKVMAGLAVLLFCILADDIWVSLFVVCSMGAACVKLNRIHIRDYVRLLGIPLAFIVMGCLAIAVEPGFGENGWYVRITEESLLRCLSVMLRAFGAASALYFLTLSTPVCDMIAVFRWFHLPKMIVELMYMIYRYIFILMDAQLKMRDAAEARLGYANFQTSCSTFGRSMGNLFIVSLKKAGAYYDAMVSRCYDGELLFLEEEKPLKAKHAAAAGFYLLMLAGIRAAV